MTMAIYHKLGALNGDIRVSQTPATTRSRELARLTCPSENRARSPGPRDRERFDRINFHRNDIVLMLQPALDEKKWAPHDQGEFSTNESSIPSRTGSRTRICQ